MSKFTVQRLNHSTGGKVALSSFANIKDAIRSCRGQNPYKGITYRVVWYRDYKYPTVVYVHSCFGRDWVPQSVSPRGVFLVKFRGSYRFGGVAAFKAARDILKPIIAPLPA